MDTTSRLINYERLRAKIVAEHGEKIAKVVDRYIETGCEDKKRIPYNMEEQDYSHLP